MAMYILEARGIVKTFPGVKALDGVDLKIKEGEVHAIVGENGAGKSTLMYTLGGIYRPDKGEIYIDGEKVVLHSPLNATEKGISIVHQELSLIPSLSVAENIFANRQPVNGINLVKKKQLENKTREMLSLFDIDCIDPWTLVKDLSIANQQVVEILKAMSFNPKVLILDEPTSSLTEIETKSLFKNINKLKENGIACIYISHHLQELFEIADTVTILRDGKYICDARVDEIDEDFLVENMVGRKIENIYGSRSDDQEIGNVVFEIKNASRKGAFQNINLSVCEGEIVGLAGLVGAGRTELGRGVFGAEPFDSGQIILDGKQLKINKPKDAIKNRIGYMTEDRKTQGLYVNFTIKVNLISNRLRDFVKHLFLDRKIIERNACEKVKQFNVVTPSTEQFIKNLSGGNQQKVLLGTWFGINPKLLIVDEPTKGVDVGAKSEIYHLLRKLASSGVAIIMISSDLMEVLGISDRIVIMKNGEIAGELMKEDATEENVIAIATGVSSITCKETM